MNSMFPEQLAAAQKANVETLFNLTNKAFEGFEKLIELDLQMIKSMLAETQENAQKALPVKDLQELLALQASLVAPVTEQVLSYARHVNEIASTTRAEFAKVADAQYEAQNRNAQALVDDVAKNAPAGSEAVIATMKSAVSAANTLYETMHKTTQQAIEMAESNSEAAAAAASRAAQEATAQAARATRK